MCQLSFRFFAEYVLAKVMHATSTSTQFPCQLSLKMADKTTTCTRIMAFPDLILSLCTLRKMHFSS